MHALVGEARGAPEARQVAPRSGAVAGLLAELASGGELGLLDRPIRSAIEGPSRQLEERAGHGRAELAHEQELLAVERQDDDGTGMLDDLARVLATLGVGDGVDAEREIPPAMDDTPLERAFGQVPFVHDPSIGPAPCAAGARGGVRAGT